MKQLPELGAILFDLDGTLYVGDTPIEGARETLDMLRSTSIAIRFLTNSTTKSNAQHIAQLTNLGFAVEDHELISTSSAARMELAAINQQLARPISIWPLVADAIKPDFGDFMWDEAAPDYVILGDIGDQWDLALINQLFNVLHSGAQLIALHKNRFWQTDDGLKADIGFFVAGLEYVCSKPALIMGKPNSDFFNRILDSLNVKPENALMVGDDIDSDVGGAQALGIHGALVKTGKFRQLYFEQSEVKPEFVLETVAGLRELLVMSGGSSAAGMKPGD